MKTAILALALVITGSTSDEHFGNPTEGNGASGVKCVLTLQTSHWSEPSDTRIRVRLTNTSDAAVELSTFPVFHFQAKQQQAKPWQHSFDYWGPVDLKAGTPAPVIVTGLKAGVSISPQRQMLRLEPMSEAEFVIQATNLKWDKLISSTWPSRQFFKCVQAGEYELYLELDSVLRSNAVSVVVEPKDQ